MESSSQDMNTTNQPGHKPSFSALIDAIALQEQCFEQSLASQQLWAKQLADEQEAKIKATVQKITVDAAEVDEILKGKNIVTSDAKPEGFNSKSEERELQSQPTCGQFSTSRSRSTSLVRYPEPDVFKENRRTNGDQIPRVSNTNQVIVEAELIVGHREVLRLTLTLTMEGLLIAESIEKEEVHHPWKKAGKGKDLHLNQRLRDIAMRILIPEGRGASDASRVMMLAETIIRCTKDPLMSVSLTIVGLLIAENIEKAVVHRIWKETGKRKGDLHLNLSIRVISTRTPIVSDASQVIVEANVMTVTLTMEGLLIAKSIEKREVHHPWRLVGVTRVDIF
ncbi:uncharacterized protein LOC105801976 isoform X2 [Gossypium raimondii]|uniref:uncharacterized protein LOC105801976 isoform X2 n=1 Tax=Gossypium raimondii TaxID=29730 RepID=UPI00227CBE98|nr:uncharacterized protein LOC105801976 isoform X2 [Gossypium raimondii]